MKAFCISHVKDVDGLGAAALVIAAKGARILLTDYDRMIEDLDAVPPDTDELVICDIGSDDSTREVFLAKLQSLSRKARVTYIDHHYLPDAAKRQIRAAGVRLVHDVDECSSMLTYLEFKELLPSAAAKIALYGAVTDYMDSSPKGKELMERTDRQFILSEATLLAEALAHKGEAEGFPELIARELAAMKNPHEIDDVPRLAVAQLGEVVKLAAKARAFGRKMGRLAYMDTTEHATGNVAKLLIEAFDVPVGVSMRQKTDGWFEVSLRGTSQCKVHLGKVAGRLALRLGGSGGGHRLAAGCRIPVDKAPFLLEALSKKV